MPAASLQHRAREQTSTLSLMARSLDPRRSRLDAVLCVPLNSARDGVTVQILPCDDSRYTQCQLVAVIPSVHRLSALGHRNTALRARLLRLSGT